MAYKPMLAPAEKAVFKPTNAPKKYFVGDLVFPKLASYKLDGVRCEFSNGELKTRSLKDIPNKQVREKFNPIAEYTKANNIISDGEIYCPQIHFQQIISMVMTQDYTTKTSIKRWAELCEKYVNITREEAFKYLKFYCFDGVQSENYDESFISRDEYVQEVRNKFPELVEEVKQHRIDNAEQVEALFEKALTEGFEGLILKDGMGRYKCGRGTVKEGLIYKVKPFEDFDAKIIGFVQGTVVDPNAEKTTNELGRSVTSRKKDDRISVERLADFVVAYKDTTVDVSVSSLTHVEREEYWKIKDSLLGKTIEYTGMLVGSSEKPRHPVFSRFREDKDV